MANRLTEIEINERIEHWRECDKSSQEASKRFGIDRRSFDRFLDKYNKEVKEGAISRGEFDQTKIKRIPKPKAGEVKRFILTCAQNNTKVHAGFMKNLEAYAVDIDAEIKVSRFTYNKTAFVQNRKQGDNDVTEEIYYDPAITRYVSDEIESLAPSLVWCANLQILPTAVNPTSGFDDYTKTASSIIPHTRVSMRPVPTPRKFQAKHLYTTGCCTLKNYIMAKAGQKAEFHHTYGALLVEVMADHSWFVRQLVGDKNGTFHDLTVQVKDGVVSDFDCVEALQWGDIHYDNIDKDVERMFWFGKDSVIDTLKPAVQLFHDLVDGISHNPHETKHYLNHYRKHKKGTRNVQDEYDNARRFIDEITYRPWCKSYVVWSNHDEFLRRFLEDSNYKTDYENRRFILETELAVTKQIDDNPNQSPSYFTHALASKKAIVLNKDVGALNIKGVLCDFHGHNGSGGARGSATGFSKSGHKTMTGHSHAAWWVAGATSAGTCSNLYLGYNNGLSSWSHTFTVLYKSGKRCQVTANAKTGKWRAE